MLLAALGQSGEGLQGRRAADIMCRKQRAIFQLGPCSPPLFFPPLMLSQSQFPIWACPGDKTVAPVRRALLKFMFRVCVCVCVCVCVYERQRGAGGSERRNLKLSWSGKKTKE